ncbi:MAG TPA: DUF5103 domain-containing protein, partial [Puia sp.]|nr:DUF5103 domain-containing protein [Puia sp.]
DKGSYEVSLFLKHGYYNYAYVTVTKGDPARVPSFDFTEGNSLEATDTYIILVYYRPIGARTDRLMGMTRLSSVASRPGS